MEKRPLGSSGIDVPVITLGTMTWGQQNSEADAHEQLDYAVDERGLYFIDTAEVYPIPPEVKLQGRTETYIGNWIEKRGKRDDLVIATKVCPGNLLQTRETNGKLTKDNIKQAIMGSLQRLQTDYVDLYQVHWPERQTNFFGVRWYEHDENDDSTAIEEVLDTLGELVKDGVVKHIGVSNETPWGVMEYLRLAKEKGLPKIVSMQNQYSLTNRTFEIGLSEMCMKEDIGLLAYSALNMGVLSGKYLDGARPAGARFTDFERNAGRYDPETKHGQEAIKKFVELAKDNDIDPSQMALAYATSRPFTTSVIIGATKMDQLKTDIDAHELTLTDTVLSGIEAIHKEFPDVTV